jgi:hypothetical protein
MIFLCAVVSGCENDADTLADQVQQLGFEILVLGEDQQPGTVFAPGTDIHIALKLINNSGKPFQWKYEYDCHLFQTEDFLLVYRRSEGETHGDYFPIGTPYQPPIYCLMINLPPYDLPPGETMLVNLPWSTNPDNHPLSTGKYYVVARVELNINGHLNTWDLRTDFEM